MKFIDNKHKKFWNEKLEEIQSLGKANVYYKSLIYTLGISETTRNNFEKIFNLNTGLINIDAINYAFQTSESAKVTRLAFSLWNNCKYDSEQDIEDKKISSNYNVGEIFCSSFATYFYEAIKIRYPEYTRKKI